MKVKMILPALTEARSPFFRPLKYSLFPPLGLSSLAGCLDPSDEVEIVDNHVERLRMEDEPTLVVIQTYVTAARRAYAIADRYREKGSYVCLGGLHATSCPDEAAAHADSIFLGPGEEAFPAFLRDFRAGVPKAVYRGTLRTLDGAPRPRRDLFRRGRYLIPNTIVASRGCPHRCDFCYKESFFRGGRQYCTRRVDDVLAEIESLPGRHVFFLDDNLLADARFAADLFAGMRGMGRVWQAGGTVAAALTPGLMELAAESGLRSLFIGFETLCDESLRSVGKTQNVHVDYGLAVRRLHDLGVMINGSFVFGMDHDDESVFGRTVEWAVSRGIETATFHILTPFPGTALHERLAAQGRILTRDWDLYDTRHAVYRPARMSPAALEEGYHQAYREFYGWGSIFRAAGTKETFAGRLRHFAYTAGWKKFEPVWSFLIKTGLVGRLAPALESVLDGLGKGGMAKKDLARSTSCQKEALRLPI